jgi:cyanophycinase-like exopeptidase
VLDGGYGGAPVLAWAHDTAVGSGAGRGDVIILTPGGGDSSSSWLTARFRSAQTISIADGATAADFAIAASLVAHAEAVWFTGGDQAKYVRWKGSLLMDAVDAVFARGGVVGGTSAGMIILGHSTNDALVTISENITTTLAVKDPYDPNIHFTQDVLHLAPLARSITDPHFIARDRMGRLSTFMARQVADGFALPGILGIAVDDGAALVIDKSGQAARLADADGPAAYVVRGQTPDQVQKGKPLVYKGIHVVKLSSAAHAFDFTRRCGKGFVRDFDVDGSQTPPYPSSVYQDGTYADECP